MKISGKIIAILPIQEGNSKNGRWKKQSFVLETEGNYPKSLCIDLWGDKIDDSNLAIGNMVIAYIELSSREWNGKWFTDVKAWKIQKGGSLLNNIGEPKILSDFEIKDKVDDWSIEMDDVFPF
tara:strand:- start:935 stop:1303 length:369 start_codon:yes stop_codon:yes gene_type:complete